METIVKDGRGEAANGGHKRGKKGPTLCTVERTVTVTRGRRSQRTVGECSRATRPRGQPHLRLGATKSMKKACLSRNSVTLTEKKIGGSQLCA